jgi:putative salt-induced outer membrane protein YdiY
MTTMLTAFLLATSLQAQTPTPPTPPAAADTASERAAAAAEKAAAAAEKAAEASARLADAVERLSTAIGKVPAAAPAAPAEEKKEDAPKADKWKGSMGLGLISLSGNSSTLTFNGLASAEYKGEDWIYALRAQAVYGRSRLPATETEPEPERSQVVALGAGLSLRGDRRFTQMVSGYVLVGGEADHIKSVEFRGTGEVGAGVIFWDETKEDGRSSSLRTDLAFRFMRETRFQYYPTPMDLADVDLGGPRVGLALRYSVSKDIVFTQEAEAVPNVLGESRLLVNTTSKLLARLTESLSLGTSFVLQYDSAPAEGKVTTDTALSGTLEMSF